MSCIQICTDKDREAWLAARREGIGSSDAPVILGASPWGSRLRLWAEKRGEVSNHLAGEKLDMGRRMEPLIADMVIEDLNAEREMALSYFMDGRLMASKERPWLRATCDAWVDDNETEWPMEIKNSSAYGAWDDGPPAHYWVQVQHQLAVTGASKALLAVLIQGWMLRWAWIERDDKFIDDTLIPECEAFWASVQSGVMPDIDASADTRKTLAELFPNSVKGAEVQLPGEWVDVGREFETLSAQRDVLELRIEEIKNRVRATLQAAEVGHVADGSRWTWKGKNGRRALRYYGKDA